MLLIIRPLRNQMAADCLKIDFMARLIVSSRFSVMK